MHHSEPAGDPSGTRKMAHPAIFTRRGSGTGGVSALTTVGSTSISNNLVPTDDYQSPVVMQPPPPAGSSSPGPQHPPHSLNLLAQSQMQPQAIPSTGAQIKKKSGFQITSVTPAQISVSTNNSIAEDTESYDDLDESHTEDLSSSEILDVSLSRATDMGGPERSSSEETLSNLHDAETPGAVSPNQPPHPLGQPQPQPPPPQGAMVNGTVHHHHHHHRLHHYHGHHQVPPPPSGAGPPPPVPSPGGPVGGTSVPASVPCPSGSLPSVAQTLPVSVGAILENACGAVPVTQTPVAVGSLSTAAAAQIGVVGLGAGNTSMLSPCPGSSSSGGGGVSPGPVNPTGASMPGIGGQTAALIPQQPSGNTSVGIAMTTAMTGATLGGQAGAMGAAHHPSSMAPVTATPGPPGPTQTQAQAPTAASSRFRVVKLDSSSEPFRKGRWTCTEYYDKESTPPPVPLAVPPVVPAAVHPAENPRQAVPETVACTEVESTSGSSVSTLSHYSESVGSGEMGGPSAALDYAQAPPQDVMTPLPKTTVAPQQMSYPPPGVQPTAPVPVGYPPPQQPPLTNPAHVMPVTQGAGLPPEYAHHQPVIQTAGKGQLPPAAQPLPQGHLQAQGPSPQIAPPSQGVALPQMLPGNVSEVAQPQHLPEQQPPAGTQPPSAPVVPSQVASNVLPRFPANPLTRAGLGQGAPLPPASALYASLPSFTATQLEDATQRLLFQHPSLFSLPKLAAAERGLEPGASLGPQDGNATNALPVSAGLFPLKSLPVDGEEDSSSGASVVAIDNKIEQAMDLVKSHLMYAVREEVEVLKEQIKELIDRNSQLEQENNLLKNLASPEQLAQFQAQVQSGSPPPSAAVPTGGQPPLPPAPQTSGPSA